MDWPTLESHIAAGESLTLEFKGEERKPLNDRDLVERRGRIYHLAARFYDAVGQPEAYVRVRGIDPIRQEAAVLQFVKAHRRIKRENVIELCGLTDRQASRLLARLVREGKLTQQGVKRWSYYEAGNV